MNLFDKFIFCIKSTYDRAEKAIVYITGNAVRNRILWMLTVFSCFSIILLLNIFTPMTADDFGYLYIHASDLPVSNISDIFQSQYNHYYLWGGRSVVHFIAQLLLLLPPIVIDILNSLAYLLYVFLIYYLIKGRGNNSISLFILINLAIWLIQPAFADTILWITGSANYLWGTVIILLFLLPYRLYSGNRQTGIRSVLFAALFFVFSILAGWTNENTAGGMLIISLLFLFYYYSKRWCLPLWSITGIIGAIIGYYIMIQAPGNTVRAGEAALTGVFIMSYRLFMHTLTLVDNYGGILLFYLIILSLFWKFTLYRKSNKLGLSFIFLFGAFAAVYAMIFSPAFPPRAWFGILTFLFIAIGIILYNLNYDYKFLRQIRFSVLGVAFVAFFLSIIPISKDIYRFDKVYKERQELVNKAKEEGQPTCEFERYVATTRFVHTEEILSKHLLSPYYGVEITFKKTLEE